MAEKNDRSNEWWWVFLPIGLGLGTAAGALMGNVGLGLVYGAALGTPLNLIFYYRRNKALHDS